MCTIGEKNDDMWESLGLCSSLITLVEIFDASKGLGISKAVLYENFDLIRGINSGHSVYNHENFWDNDICKIILN